MYTHPIISYSQYTMLLQVYKIRGSSKYLKSTVAMVTVVTMVTYIIKVCVGIKGLMYQVEVI